ncbi:TonB-dependent hemoglobin/transferrin/lactoferrin family receptor [Campylobacter curvus]|uniref:TonB-dependent hemoglobin/transferrin/lactoferrin family receptor n=1 Tax=Campylobacter curvus TaxID=200 RepID=UPI001470486B|nr:TonB-dependent hemoglobin/transferrin/lactoferrin family receptor [Campylobacter curvus]
MSGNRLKLSLIALLILNTGGLFAADEKDVKLDSIEVIGTTPDDDVKTKKVGETKKSAETLSKQQVSDSRDLVKYETGVTVVEAGRFGASGYAIRGVDENRVGIMIDGLRQAETLSSTGFKELFEGYGNFNNTRNGVEMENVKLATITKGADSIKTGSGALGGSVMFETKDARDYLIDKDWYFGFKNGYQSRDTQNFRSVSAAARFKWFDILIINTLRDGHETKNYFYDIYNGNEDRSHVGKTREKADPYHIKRKSTMVKVGFQPSDEHRFSVMHDDSTLSSRGEDLSYSLRTWSQGQEDTKLGERRTNDKSTRKNTQFTYENFVETPFWDSFKISYSTQKIKNKAKTDEYCNNDGCNNVRNPSGLNLVYDKEAGVYKIVDKNNKELSFYDKKNKKRVSGDRHEAKYADAEEFMDSNGNVLEWKNNGGDPDYMLMDCSKIDCSKKFRVSRLINTGRVDADGDDIWEHTFADRDIITKEYHGIKYGVIKKDDPAEELRFVTPQSEGFAENNYHDRDLNTDTKQFDINFDKEFELFHTSHSLKYGGLLDKTKKSMVDQDGYIDVSSKWWATDFFGYDNWGTIPRPDKWPTTNKLKKNTSTKQTYLVPVETETKAFNIGDNINLTDWLGLDLNYRYDIVKHSPSYDESIPVPPGMIIGVFKPLIGYNPYGNPQGYKHPIAQQNLKENLDILLQNREFKSDSYSLGLNLDPLEWMRVQFKYSKGFRAPTSDEMYMTFKHPSASIRPNINLKAEIAKTKEAALTFYKNQSFVSFDVFKTDYENFIDLVYIGEFPIDDSSQLGYPFWQNKNRDNAKVDGFEITSRLEMDEILPSLRGFRLGYKFTHQKGRMRDDEGNTIAMNAIQPTTSVYTLGYSTPGDKYGIDLYITDVGEKKAEDTYNMYWKQQEKDPNYLVKGKPVTDSAWGWRSGNYTVFDLIAYAKPAKNFAFSFGLYNITDQKYMTWDSARSIRGFGTTNLIDQNTGAGIKRFYAPGRNFKFTWEIKF